MPKGSAKLKRLSRALLVGLGAASACLAPAAGAEDFPRNLDPGWTIAEHLRKATRIVYCASSDDLSLNDIETLARMIKLNDLKIISGYDRFDETGYTIYFYAGAPGNASFARECLRNFPQKDGPPADLIKDLEADLWWTPDVIYDAVSRAAARAGHTISREQSSTQTGFDGPGWKMIFSVSRDEGAASRAWFLSRLFDLPLKCLDAAECDPRVR